MPATTDSAFEWILENALAAADDLSAPTRENRGGREVGPERLRDAQKQMRQVASVAHADGRRAIAQLEEKIDHVRTRLPDSLDHKEIVKPLQNLILILQAKIAASAGQAAATEATAPQVGRTGATPR